MPYGTGNASNGANGKLATTYFEYLKMLTIKTVLAIADTANTIRFFHNGYEEILGTYDLAVVLRFVKVYELTLCFETHVMKLCVNNEALSTYLLDYPNK